jgi:hypothetical protein|tara:strand:- start:390 stop:587 length:198 start_codon:yes stop_codon:yes gene_type:complete
MSYIGNLPPSTATAGVSEGNYFYNYSELTSTVSTTIPAGRNAFIQGDITIASGVTWSVDGTLTIL